MDEDKDVIDLMKSIKAKDFFNTIEGGEQCCGDIDFLLVINEYKSIVGSKPTSLEMKVDSLKRKLAMAMLAANCKDNKVVLEFTNYKDYKDAKSKLNGIKNKLESAVNMLDNNTPKNNTEHANFYETKAMISINAGFNIEDDVDLLTFLYLMKAIKTTNKVKE